MKQHLIFVTFVAAATLAASAENFTFRTGATRWDVAESYVDAARVPTAGDTITLPSNCAATLDAADTASWAVVEAVDRVIPTDDTSTLTLHVASGEATFTTPFALANPTYTYSNYAPAYTGVGTLAKTGAGTLALGSAAGRCMNGSARCDYFCTLNLAEGAIVLPQDVTAAGDFVYGPLQMEKGTTLTLPRFSDETTKTLTIVWRLNGDGTVTATGRGSRFRVYGWKAAEASVFAGKLTGALEWEYQGGRVRLTGTESDFVSSFHVYENCGSGAGGWWGGYVEAATLAKKGVPCSIGAGNSFETGYHGGGLVYLGSEEVACDRNFVVNDTTGTGCMNFLHGGAYGGINWSGEWKQPANASNYTMVHQIVLDGSNTTRACVMSGKFQNTPYNNEYYPFYVIKRGTGIWRMADNAERTCGGGYAIENGTLQYDSIAETNVICALGTANILTDKFIGQDLAGHAVDYAYLLGTAETEGTMEFTGANGGSCSTRPVAVNGRARFKVSGSGDFAFNGFYPVADSTLVLETSRAAADGTVKIGGLGTGTAGMTMKVVKEGSGTIELAGDQTIASGIDVRAGTLEMTGVEPIRWVRWTITERAQHNARYSDHWATDYTSGYLQMEEFGLFDADGKRLDKGLTELTSVESIAAMPAKSAVLDLDPAFTTGSFSHGALSSYWDGGAGSASGKWGGAIFNASLQNNVFTRPGYPTYYFRFVERLPEDAQEIASYDLAGFFGENDGQNRARLVTGVTVEGSPDGTKWEILDVNNDIVLPTASQSGRWYSDPDNEQNSVSVSGAYHTLKNHKGFAISGKTTNCTDRIGGPLSVAAGATFRVKAGTLTVSSLKLSTTANGTIEGVTFADSGTLDLGDGRLTSGRQTMPVTFANCVNVEALANWTLKRNGQTPSNTTLSVDAEGHLVVTSAGLILLVR